LSEDGIGRVFAFARKYETPLEINTGIFNVKLFSAEAHFHAYD
jgi:hypothetical protein